MSFPLKKDDPAYWMLDQGLRDKSKRSTTTVFKVGCYICEDPVMSVERIKLYDFRLVCI
jgi:hypothetical protein